MTRMLFTSVILLTAMAAVSLGAEGPSPAADRAAVSAASCAALTARLADTLRIESATYVPSGATNVQVPAGGGRYTGRPAEVPGHCLITGQFEERTGSDGMRYAFKVEMRLPLDWNGKLLYQGGGGLNGSVNPALGNVLGTSSAPHALARGFAVISTDSGHDSAITPGASFARDQLAMLNYAYASIGKVVDVGKRVADAFYGERPEKTYFWGCSNGGREALIAAQRYPQDFDGIIAMDPAFELSKSVMLSHFSTQTYYSLGHPGDPGALTPADTQLVSQAVLRKCDALDGRSDGLVFNHADCHFDPGVLECKPGQTEACLSTAKLDVLRRAFAGPLDANGQPAFGSWPWDAGVGGTGWLAWQTGLYNPATKQTFDYFPALIRDGMAHYFFYPPVSEQALVSLDHSRVPEGMRMIAALTDADGTQFSTFAKRGGKMILMTGWGDPVFSASRLVEWYERLGRDAAATGGDAGDFSRLFLNPGMNHCGGGPALDDMDLLTALDDWVVKGKAPERVIAQGSFLPGQSRPLCRYPAYAQYSGTGDGKSAGDYECRVPAK